MPALSHKSTSEHRKVLRLWISHCLKELGHKLREEITTFAAEEHLEEMLDLYPQVFLASAVEATQSIKDEIAQRRLIATGGQAYPEKEG